MAAGRHGDSDGDGGGDGGRDTTDGEGDASHDARHRHRLTSSKACAITPSGPIPAYGLTAHDA